MPMRGRIIQAGGAGRDPLTALSNAPKFTTLYSEPWDDVAVGRCEYGSAPNLVTEDALNCRHGDNADGIVLSAKRTADATTANLILYDKNLPGNPIDVAEMSHLILDYFIAYAAAVDQAKTGTLRAVLSSTAANPTTTTRTAWSPSANDGPHAAPGWHRAIWRLGQLGDGGGGFDAAALRSMYVRWDKSSLETYFVENTAISVDRMAVVKRTLPAKPRLFLCFDDGHIDNLAASEFLDTLGIHGTFYINSKAAMTGTMLAAVYEGAAALELADLLDMQDRGHLIANHGHAHLELVSGAEFEAADEEEWLSDMLRGREWLLANDLTRGADLLAVPGGFLSLTKGALWRALGEFRQVRLTRPETGANIPVPLIDGGYMQPLDWLDPRLPTIYSTAVAEADLIAQADAAIADQATYGLLMHGDDLSAAGRRAGLAYWAAKRDAGLLDIVTMDELLA